MRQGPAYLADGPWHSHRRGPDPDACPQRSRRSEAIWSALPKGRLSKLEQLLLARPWQQARENVAVKLLPQDGELYVFAESRDRGVAKERAMRRRQLKWLWRRLAQISAMKLTREELLMKLGSARSQTPTAWRLVDIDVDPKIGKPHLPAQSQEARRQRASARRPLSAAYQPHRQRPGEAVGTLSGRSVSKIEEAFKTLKSDLALRPIFHQREDRIEAHIFIAFALPTVCTSRWEDACTRSPRASHHEAFWKNLPPCR